METLEQKLKRLLESQLADGRVELETLANGHVCGDVIASEFEGLSYEDRRKRIKKIVDAHLSPEEAFKVSTLITYTPTEWSYEPTES